MPGVIDYSFDPTVAPLGLSIRLETLALCAAIFLVLVLVALRAGRAPASDETIDERSAGRLRRDDLILIGFGVVPGAVVGGRLDYGLLHLDYYLANPGALTDPSQGGLGLTLAVVLGIATGLAVARLLAAPIDRWLHVAGLPVLVGLGLGKLAMLLGGAGQGSYSDASWAVSFSGPGPWGSMNPSFPALPSQALEGGLVLTAAFGAVLVPLLLRLRLRPWHRIVRPGWSPPHEWWILTGSRGFATLLSLWIAARFVAAFTWRDARVLGPLNAEQILLVVVLMVVLIAPSVPAGLTAVRRRWSARRAGRAAAKARRAELEAKVAS